MHPNRQWPRIKLGGSGVIDDLPEDGREAARPRLSVDRFHHPDPS